MSTLVAISQDPILHFENNDGTPLIGGKLFTYVGGIQYPTYSESTGSVALPNPIILNNRGDVATNVGTSSPLFVDPNVSYTFTLFDAKGNQIWTAPNITCAATTPVVLELITSTVNQQFIGTALYPQTAAEMAAGVTPTTYVYPEGDLRRYGADATGATFSDPAFVSAIAVAHNMTQPTLIVNGQFKVVSINLSNMVGEVAAPDFNNRGLRIIGVGVQSSTITCIASVANTGIGIDAAGMAYWHWSDIRFNFGTSTANAPQVGLLLGKTSAGGSVFAGIGKFECCQFIGWGNSTTFNVFNQGAEDIDWNNCVNINDGTGRAYCFSRANTPGITSPNTTLEVPADSMTTQTFSGGESIIQANGDCCVFFDIGSTTGFGGFDFGSTYVNLSGASTVFLKDNGGAGSTITGVHAANIDVEFNGGAGTNQVMIISAQYPNNFHFKGSSAYTAVAQISTPFVFGNPLLDSHIAWTGNAVPGASQPTTLISGTQAFGCIVQTTGPASSVVFSGGGQVFVMASDYIQSTQGATTLTQPLTTSPGTGDATPYTLAIFKGGVRTSNNTDGGIRRITKAGVTTSLVAIYSDMTFGELVTVTGVNGGGAIFADLLMCSYNTVTVISSNSQQGSPAARTYTAGSGTLNLSMASGTYGIVVQSLITGGQV